MSITFSDPSAPYPAALPMPSQTWGIPSQLTLSNGFQNGPNFFHQEFSKGRKSLKLQMMEEIIIEQHIRTSRKLVSR